MAMGGNPFLVDLGGARDPSVLPVSAGGTAAMDAGTARANLGLAIGSQVQAHGAGLDDIAGLSPSDGQYLKRVSGHWTAAAGGGGGGGVSIGDAVGGGATNYALLAVDGSGNLTQITPGTSGQVVASDGTQWGAAGTIPLSPPIGLAIHNNASTPSTKIDYAARCAVLLDGSNNGSVYYGISGTIDAGTTGAADGLDTGSQASNTLYYLWLIGNGTTCKGLLSTSSTAPTMPSGYTYKFLAGWVVSNGSTHFLPFHQEGNFLAYDDCDADTFVVKNVSVTVSTAYSVNLTTALSYPVVGTAICKRVTFNASAPFVLNLAVWNNATTSASSPPIESYGHPGATGMTVGIDSSGIFKYLDFTGGTGFNLRLQSCILEWY